jgi:hypothetical protein
MRIRQNSNRRSIPETGTRPKADPPSGLAHEPAPLSRDPLLSRAVPQAVPSISSALLFSPQIRHVGVSPSAAKDPGIRANECPARGPKILIANPELESAATPTKQTTEPQSNRKKIAIFSSRHDAVHSQIPVSRPSTIHGHKSRTAELLIATFNISGIRLTPAAATITYFLIATKQRFRQIQELRALACLQSVSVVISNSVEI